jgi:hypothetical protein
VDSPGIHRPDRDGLLTLLAGRTASLAVQEADIPCTSLLTSDHRKRTVYRATPKTTRAARLEPLCEMAGLSVVGVTRPVPNDESPPPSTDRSTGGDRQDAVFEPMPQVGGQLPRRSRRERPQWLGPRTTPLPPGGRWASGCARAVRRGLERLLGDRDLERPYGG